MFLDRTVIDQLREIVGPAPRYNMGADQDLNIPWVQWSAKMDLIDRLQEQVDSPDRGNFVVDQIDSPDELGP